MTNLTLTSNSEGYTPMPAEIETVFTNQHVTEGDYAYIATRTFNVPPAAYTKAAEAAAASSDLRPPPPPPNPPLSQLH